MAFENPVLVKSFAAAADLSTHQFKAVKLNGSAKLALCGVGEIPVGFLQNDPTADQTGDYMALGITKAVAEAAIAEGARVTLGALGKVKTATAGMPVCGMALIAAAADGDILSVQLGAYGADGEDDELRIVLTPAAEAANAIQVVGSVVDRKGVAVAAAKQIWIRSLAITADKGDLSAAAVPVGTVLKSINPVTGPNEQTMETTAGGLFSFAVANDIAETTEVMVSVDQGLPRILKLTFA